MKQIYDLSCLKWIIAGVMLQIAIYLTEAIAEGLGQLTAFLNNTMSITVLAASILIIFGLFKASGYSPALRIARDALLIAVVFSAAAVLLISFGSEDSRGIAASFGASIAQILMNGSGIAAIIAMYQMLRGCREIAECQGQYLFAGKCRKAWYGYLLILLAGIVMGAAGLVLPELALTMAARGVVCFIVWGTFREFHGQEMKTIATGDLGEETALS